MFVFWLCDKLGGPFSFKFNVNLIPVNVGPNLQATLVKLINEATANIPNWDKLGEVEDS